MTIPEPDKFAEQEGYKPFPPRWERWLSAVREALLASQPTAGRNVTTDEHIGKGTVINVADSEYRRGGGGPPQITGACCKDGDCSILSEAACTSSGGTYQGDNTTCEAVDCGQATSGACCVDTACSIETPADCATLGGTYQGDNTPCDPNPCLAEPTGACCKDGNCNITTQADCEAGGGTYQGDGTTCAGVDCGNATSGACCHSGGVCTAETPADCAAIGGTYQGDNTGCDSAGTTCNCCFENPCDGLRYKTRTVTASGTFNTDSDTDPTHDFKHHSFSSTGVQTCNGDGSVACSVSGSGTTEDFTHGSAINTPINCAPSGADFFTIVSELGWGFGAEWQVPPPLEDPPSTSDCSGSATWDYTHHSLGRTTVINATRTVVYSDPC